MNHAKDACDELVKRASDLGNAPFVAFVQEPYVYNGSTVGLNSVGKVLFSNSKNDGNIRSCILHSFNLNMWLIPDLSDGDLTIGAMKIDGTLTYFASFYLDINHSIADSSMVATLSEINKRKIPCLMSGDSNSHSTIWTSPLNNSRGDNFEDFIFENNLSVHNTGSTPTFYCSRAKTHIDVTFSNEFLTKI